MVSEEEFKSLLSRHNKLAAAFRRLAENLTAHEKKVEGLESKFEKFKLNETTKRTEMENKVLEIEHKYEKNIKADKVQTIGETLQEEIDQINLKIGNLESEYKTVTNSITKRAKYLEDNRNYIEELKEDVKCLKTFDRERKVCEISVKSHREMKRRKVDRCNICEESFQYSHELEIHMKMHTSDKPYRCKKCGKGFYLACRLSKHMEIHDDLKKKRACHYFNNGKNCPY